jgi:hypothetical protein
VTPGDFISKDSIRAHAKPCQETAPKRLVIAAKFLWRSHFPLIHSPTLNFGKTNFPANFGDKTEFFSREHKEKQRQKKPGSSQHEAEGEGARRQASSFKQSRCEKAREQICTDQDACRDGSVDSRASRDKAHHHGSQWLWPG